MSLPEFPSLSFVITRIAGGNIG